MQSWWGNFLSWDQTKTAIKQELVTHEFTLALPPDLKTETSVEGLTVNDVVYDKNPADIWEVLARQSTRIGEGRKWIYEFPKSATLQIAFS